MKLSLLLVDRADIAAALLPLTYTRPVSMIRPGLLTIRERYALLMPDTDIYIRCADWLSEKFGSEPQDSAAAVCVDSSVWPSAEFAARLRSLEPGECLCDGTGRVIACGGTSLPESVPEGAERVEVTAIRRLYDIFGQCGRCVCDDFGPVTAGRTGAPVHPSVTVVGPAGRLFIEPDASVTGCTVNTDAGPVYIGAGATVMEGACLRGPLAIGAGTQVRMGARVYGPSAFGPQCRIGGELDNVVMFGYSNKGHDGFLGNAVVGEWCNLGAGCSASNLKNDYSEIKLWNYPARRFLRTGLIHCGPVLADHAKAGINTMLNTATVLGVGVNLHGTGFPRNFVASFQEGSAAGYSEVPLRKFLDIARRMMERRGVTLTEADERLYGEVYHLTRENRE